MRTGPRTSFLWLVGVLLSLSASPAAAALRPELDRPYNLQVVLHLAEHRTLSPAFREELTRQLGDFLRLNFGPLAQVEVVHTHPLLDDVLVKGPEQALEGWDELSDTRTVFVLVDFEGGRYRLRVRQHDGMTGLASPVVRQVEVGDRELVARKAALLVDRDFGPAGTLLEVAGDTVKVGLRGGALGVPLKRWLKFGDVFAVARVTEEGDKQRASRLEWALLQVVDDPDREGVCRCRYSHRYREDELRPGPGVAGFRCLKLTTDNMPLRLRLLDDKTQLPLGGLQVHVSAKGFGQQARELTTGPDGLIVTPESYRNVAFVRVLGGAGQVGQMPVAIVDHRTVVCRLNVNAEAAAQGQLALRAERWLRRIYDDLRLADERVGQLNALLSQSPEAALGPAEGGFKNMTEEIASLSEERDALRAAAAKEASARVDLSEGIQRLEELQRRRVGLERFKDRLAEVIREAASPKTKALKAALERARLLEVQAEFQQAIDLYRKILADDPGQEKVRAQLEHLESQWKLRNPRHAEARQFVYDIWPRPMDTAALKTNLPRAREFFVLCREVGDHLTPRKMLKADLAHAAALKQRLQVLRRAADSEDNRAEAKTIAQLAEELGALNAMVLAFVKEDAPPTR